MKPKIMFCAKNKEYKCFANICGTSWWVGYGITPEIAYKNWRIANGHYGANESGRYSLAA